MNEEENEVVGKSDELRSEEAEIDRLVAEAEERGYIRGRTEALNERLAGPDLYQEPACRNPVTILAGIRESVWN